MTKLFRPLIILGLITFFSTQAVAFPEGEQSIRGLWVVRHTLTTPEKIEGMLKTASECGITDLFVQVRGRGDAYYNSRHEAKAFEIPDPDFDPLAYLLSRRDAYPMKIHAWLNVFYVWSRDSLPSDKNHVVQRNGHWLAQPAGEPSLVHDYPHSVKRANVEGLYISPMQPDAQEHFLAILQDLLSRYELDGIHLDYIRYPNPKFDINPDVIKGFRRRYVLHPASFLNDPEKFAMKFSVAGYESFYYSWRKYLMDGLSDFVSRIDGKVRKHSGKILLSAAVKPDIALARWDYYQDWVRWLREGWLNFAIPMNYTPDAAIFQKRLNDYSEKVDPAKYLMGVALYNQPPDMAIRKISQNKVLNNLGFVLFSYNQLAEQALIREWLKRQIPLSEKNGSQEIIEIK